MTAVDFTQRGAVVTARLEDGGEQRWDTRFVADASGRDTFLASRMGIKRRNRKHNSAAIYGHFTGAKRLPGKAEGNITVFWFDHGWFWFIPLADGTTSVGAVCWPYYMKTRRTSPDEFFLDTVALCPALAERLRDAKLTAPATATGNYSYVADRTMGRNYLMLGDAYTFIDPVFSTGVLLAMQSAFVGADTIETCFDRPAQAGAALRRFDATMRRGPGIFSWLIYRVTTPAIRALFMAPSNRFRVQEALISVLAGDIYRQTPWRARMLVFRAIYHKSVYLLRQSVSAWLRRRRAIHPRNPAGRPGNQRRAPASEWSRATAKARRRAHSSSLRATPSGSRRRAALADHAHSASLENGASRQRSRRGRRRPVPGRPAGRPRERLQWRTASAAAQGKRTERSVVQLADVRRPLPVSKVDGGNIR